MKREIPNGLSVYLDVMRLGAALVVVLSHVWSLAFPHLPLPWPGHSAVVVFFVLSGFVISHAARPELGLRSYAVHRIARIYPVVLATVLLVAALSFLAPVPALHYAGTRGMDWLDTVLNMLFLGQSWMDVALPYNGPFWSLNYEVWYYILFGIWLYCRNRYVLAGAALVAGPKILLLLPVWLLGVVLYRWMVPLERRRALLLFLVSLAAELLFFWFDVGVKIRGIMIGWWPDAMALAGGSNQFVGDFILGLLVALNFLAAASLRMNLLLKCERAIRYLSSFTFSTYVFHMPLTVLIWSVAGVHAWMSFFGFLAVGIFVMGSLTERQTKWYRALLSAPFFQQGEHDVKVSPAELSGHAAAPDVK